MDPKKPSVLAGESNSVVLNQGYDAAIDLLEAAIRGIVSEIGGKELLRVLDIINETAGTDVTDLDSFFDSDADEDLASLVDDEEEELEVLNSVYEALYDFYQDL